jgi:hypothetical protein
MISLSRFFLSAVLTAVVALSFSSCATTTKKGTVALSAESRTHASDLFDQAKSERAAGNLDAAALAATELVNNYSGFALMDQPLNADNTTKRPPTSTRWSAITR